MSLETLTAKEGVRYVRIPIAAGVAVAYQELREMGYAVMVVSGISGVTLHAARQEAYTNEYSILAITGAGWPVPFGNLWISASAANPGGTLILAILTLPPTDHMIRAVFGAITVSGALTSITSIINPVTVQSGGTGVSVSNIPPTAITQGQKTVAVAGTAEILAASVPCQAVILRALDNNTGMVYVGGIGVTSATGLILAASESITLAISNVATVYLDVSVNGEGVRYLVFN